MRDILVHAYLGKAIEIVRNVIQNKPPELNSSVQRLLAEACHAENLSSARGET